MPPAQSPCALGVLHLLGACLVVTLKKVVAFCSPPLLLFPYIIVPTSSPLLQEDGSYAGFDTLEFPSRSGGKAEAVRHIKSTRGLRRVVMVGDGATDLEARQPGGAEIFIG